MHVIVYVYYERVREKEREGFDDNYNFCMNRHLLHT